MRPSLLNGVQAQSTPPSIRVDLGDKEVGRLLALLVMFSPIGENLRVEESLCLKQYQSQLTIILYNHILSSGTTDNMKATKRVSDIISIINDFDRWNFRFFNLPSDINPNPGIKNFQL